MIFNSPVKVWRKQKEIASLLGKRGKIVSYTIVRVPPSGFEGQAPYVVVVVSLDRERKRVGQLIEWEEKDLRIGRKVETVYRRVREPDREGVIPYGIKFKPIK